METTTFNYPISSAYSARVAKPSIITRFMNWCKGQERDRILWIGIALAGHGCVITPITMMFIYLGGNSLALFMLAMSSMGIALVTNLAAMPTKVTIPAFALSVLIDLGIIAACIANAVSGNTF